MARIRSIKPEFQQSNSMTLVSREARLTFILLWPQADDAGRCRGNSRMLASALFPCDDDAAGLIDGWLGELEKQACILRYKVNTYDYIQILNWDHQKIDHPSPSKFPTPPGKRRVKSTTSNRETNRAPREETLPPRDHSPLEGIKDQDQGKDQEESSEAKASAATAATEPIPKTENPSPSGPADDKTWLFRVGLAWLHEETGKPAASFRSLLGRWLRDVGDDATVVRAAIEEARDKRIADPVPWLTKTIPERNRSRIAGAHPVDAADDGWRQKVRGFKGRGTWLVPWGPRPDEASCDAPSKVLLEFGYLPVLPGFLRRTA